MILLHKTSRLADFRNFYNKFNQNSTDRALISSKNAHQASAARPGTARHRFNRPTLPLVQHGRRGEGSPEHLRPALSDDGRAAERGHNQHQLPRAAEDHQGNCSRNSILVDVSEEYCSFLAAPGFESPV